MLSRPSRSNDPMKISVGKIIYGLRSLGNLQKLGGNFLSYSYSKFQVRTFC